MSRIYTTPWSRTAIAQSGETEAIRALLTEYDVWLGAKSPGGPFIAFLVRDRTRLDDSRSVGGSPLHAVRRALATRTGAVVTVDGEGFIRSIEEAAS